jgi:hypothetical protein
MRMHPLLFFIVIGLAPSAIFGAANYLFNRVQHTPTEGEQGEFFERYEVPWVNGLLYPVAVFAVVGFAWPVITCVAQIGKRRAIDATILPKLRRRALWVGDFAGWVGMALWIVSGAAFPGLHRLHFGQESFYDTRKFAEFIISQIATGWISSTLTFFLITGMFVRVFYPVLVRPEQSSSDEVSELARLSRRCTICLALTFVSMFAALGLIALPGSVTPTTQIWHIILPIVGAFGSGWAFWMLQLIRADLTALESAIDPQHDAGTLGADTVGSSLSGTR